MSAPIIPDEFMEWFRKNYPGPDTIIHKPDWHAPRIYSAAIHAVRADLCDPLSDPRVNALVDASEALLEKLDEQKDGNFVISIGLRRERLRAALRDLAGVK